MDRRLIWIGATILALQTLGCGSTSVSQVTAPDIARCQTSLAAVPTIPAAGGRMDVGVMAARECAWTAASNSAWIQVAPATGQGEASITLTTTANPQGTARSGNITLNGSQFGVTQAASPCTFTLASTSITAPPQSSRSTIDVTTLTGCQWTASSPASWIDISPATSTGSGSVTLAITANPGTVARSANISVAGRTVAVTQSAPERQTPSPGTGSPGSPGSPGGGSPGTPSQPCTLALDPLTNVVRGKGGDESVKVITGPTCSWTATPNVTWIHIKGDPSGVGTRDVKYEVDRNKSGTGRIGTISIDGLAHVVLQGDDGEN